MRWKPTRDADDGQGSHGRFVVLVGPDGVGKTTLATALADRRPDSTRYFHFLPAGLRRLEERPPPDDNPQAKNRKTGSVPLGWLRISRNLVRSWIAYLLAVQPAIRQGHLVIADRWVYGYVAQPVALNFYGPDWLARIAARLAPRPALVANLAAPPEVVHARKPDLGLGEIAAELPRRESLPVPTLTIDARRPKEAIASDVLRELGL